MRKDRDELLKQADSYIQFESIAYADGLFKVLVLAGIKLCVRLLVRMNEHIEDEWDD